MRKRFFKKVVWFLVFFIIINLMFAGIVIWQKGKTIKEGRHFSALRWQELYNQPKNSIDLLFVGSSHGGMTFVPEIFDKELNISSFNMGNGGQTLVSSYFVLKEILETQQPKVVILEMYHTTLMGDTNFVGIANNIFHMRSNKVKADFFIKGTNVRNKIEFVLPPHSYNDSFIRKTIGVISKKIDGFLFGMDNSLSKAKVKVVAKKDKKTTYFYKGYCMSDNIADIREFKSLFDEDYEYPVHKKQLKYLYKIINLCRDKKNSLFFVTAPLPPLSFDKDYVYEIYENQIYNYINQIALDNKIEYIDYNMVNKAKKNFINQDFSDSHHLNYSGAQKVSKDLAKRIKSMNLF